MKVFIALYRTSLSNDAFNRIDYFVIWHDHVTRTNVKEATDRFSSSIQRYAGTEHRERGTSEQGHHAVERFTCRSKLIQYARVISDEKRCVRLSSDIWWTFLSLDIDGETDQNPFPRVGVSCLIMRSAVEHLCWRVVRRCVAKHWQRAISHLAIVAFNKVVVAHTPLLLVVVVTCSPILLVLFLFSLTGKASEEEHIKREREKGKRAADNRQCRRVLFSAYLPSEKTIVFFIWKGYLSGHPVRYRRSRRMDSRSRPSPFLYFLSIDENPRGFENIHWNVSFAKVVGRRTDAVYGFEDANDGVGRDIAASRMAARLVKRHHHRRRRTTTTTRRIFRESLMIEFHRIDEREICRWSVFELLNTRLIISFSLVSRCRLLAVWRDERTEEVTEERPSHVVASYLNIDGFDKCRRHTLARFIAHDRFASLSSSCHSSQSSRQCNAI